MAESGELSEAYCPRCGRTRERGWIYCPACGYRLVSEALAPTEPLPSVSPHGRSRLRRWLLLALGVGIALLGLLGAEIGASSGGSPLLLGSVPNPLGAFFPTLTPTPTATATPTATPTLTPTPSPTFTPTPSPTWTPTSVPTATPTPTPKPVSVPSPTPTGPVLLFRDSQTLIARAGHNAARWYDLKPRNRVVGYIRSETGHDITFYIRDPDWNMIVYNTRVTEARFSFIAAREGKYIIYLDNSGSIFTNKVATYWWETWSE